MTTDRTDHSPDHDAPAPSPGDSPEAGADSNALAAEKVRGFPKTPGVYLMKDGAGRVLYVGKAKDLRSRAGSYFLKAALEDPRTSALVPEIRDADCIETESEVDAVLLEARLIKDIQPPYNRDLKDGKTFPYLEVTSHEPYPRVRVTRTPQPRGAKLYGPFVAARDLRGVVQVLQRIFKFRTCDLDIDPDDSRWRWFRPCLLHSIQQCTAPCNFRISKEEYRKSIRRLHRFLRGGRQRLLAEMRREMLAASKERRFEEAAELRDQIQLIETLDQRGNLDQHVQPEVFPIDPKKGMAGLRQILRLPELPRTIEGIDIAHLAGKDTVASLVRFLDGLPFKPGYRRFRIQSVHGVDDFASMREVILRRFRTPVDDPDEADPWPDILLVDGGRGQLNSVVEAFRSLEITPPKILSLAKREEEVFLPDQEQPLQLSRHSFALRLLQYVRDEAHRFAQHYHHILRKRSTLGR